MIDFSKCEAGFRDYGGSDGKRSIKYNDSYYMIKFPSYKQVVNDLQTSHINNVISEKVASDVINTVGINVHETLLGLYNDEIVVACKDFTDENYRLHEFSWYMKNIYRKDEIGRIVQYGQLYEVMQKTDIKAIYHQAVDAYWDMFIMDALIGNFDRHKENWGYLVNESNGDIKLAPIYDCGSSLYPNLSEEGMKEILKDPTAINERVYIFPKATLNKNPNNNKIEKYGYLEMMTSGIDKNCEEAIKRVVPRVNMRNIEEVIDKNEVITDVRKHFYKTMLNARYEKILLPAFERIAERSFTYEVAKATAKQEAERDASASSTKTIGKDVPEK